MDEGVWQVEVYSDRELKYDRVWKIGLSAYKGIFLFVFSGEKLVSYGGVLSNKFYVKHLGKELKGRVVKGKKFSVLKRGSELEIKFKRDDFRFLFDYKPLGSRLTPFIHFDTLEWDCAILPEFGKVYKAWSVSVKSMGGMLLVSERIQRKNRQEDHIDRVYALTPSKEYLVYEGSSVYYKYSYSPKFFKVGNVMVVELDWVNERAKEYFVRSPELNYFFVQFYNGHEIDQSKKVAKISFDLENWIEVKAGNMVFKKEPELQCEYSDFSIFLDRVLLECLEKTSEEKAPQLYKAFTRKIQSVLKKLTAYMERRDLAPSQDLHL